jgi:hypothetical protein
MRIFLFLATAIFAANVEAGEFGLNFYGFSYHPDDTDSLGRDFKPFNPGIGARYSFIETKKHILLCDGGIYSNSTGHVSKYVSAGYRFKLPYGFEIGPNVAVYQSPDQNSGKAFLAPLMIFSYRIERVLFHVVPIPRYKDVNRNAAVGFYATVILF